VLSKSSTALPEYEPIAWRETTKKSLGTTRYLFRMLVAMEVPLLVVCLLIVVTRRDSSMEGVSAMLFLLWFIAVLLVSVKSASLVSGERSHQTLDVLIVTPLTSREIIHQKFRGVRRLMGVLCVPFLTIFLFETWWKSSVSAPIGWQRYTFNGPLYLVCSVLSIAIYLPMIAWLSLLIGLRVRTQTRAIIGSLAAIVGWCILPFFVLIPLISAIRPGSDSGFVFLMLLSPIIIVPLNEFTHLGEFAKSPWIAVIINFFIYGTFLILLRYFCLANADRYLGRSQR
jgi:ABC-type transport system involved in multi-copper enzyme maturation permease subunit